LSATRETVHTPHDVGKGVELFPGETIGSSGTVLLEGSDDEVLSSSEGTPLPDSGAALPDLRRADSATTAVVAHLPDPLVLVESPS
jgi:hypothetical protein